MKTRGSAVLAAPLLLALAACEVASNDASYSTELGLRQPIAVTSQTVRMPVFVAGAELAAVDRDRLAEFVDDFLRSGGGVLEVAVPQVAGRDAAVAQAALVRAAAMRRGVRPYEVQMRLTDDPPGTPLVVSYRKYAAQGPDCGDHSRSSANSRNAVHPEYGCAYQNNIAAMVANPADLLRPRGEEPPDANRRSAVIERYRLGQPAEGELGGQARRGVSRIIPQSD